MKLLSLILLFSFSLPLSAKELEKKEKNTQNAALLDCVRPVAKYDMKVNNVRARLLTGGDLFSEAAYITPNPRPGQLPVSSIFAAGVWMGGVDKMGNIKLSAMAYRSSFFDFFSGPLDLNGTTEINNCEDWDKIFSVKGISIEKHIQAYKKAIELNQPMKCESIPEDIKYWPAKGNPFWKEEYDWELPDKPLANYWDMDNDGKYNPCAGDYPMLFSRDCDYAYHEGNRIPAEINYFIFNDNGGPQTLSGPSAMQMEFQVNAFAYESNDEINDITFYEYKLINKSSDDLLDCYFSWWVDPDLGCYTDDFFGCDPSRNMAYVYNEDALDGSTECLGSNTYGEDIPILGFDFVNGPMVSKVFKRDINGNFIFDNQGKKVILDPDPMSGKQDTLVEGRMSSFCYMATNGIDGFPIATDYPQFGQETGFYNYIRGLWADGTPYSSGDSGFNPTPTDTVKFAFPDDPNDNSGWSMCTAGLPEDDRTFVMSTGPMLMQPGSVNLLVMTVFTAFDNSYPCPDLSKLRYVDELAQKLMNDCFENGLTGPDAPEISGVEADKQITLNLYNETYSNNYNEGYKVKDSYIQEPFDPYYIFEGYKIFQLRDGSVTRQQINDSFYVREILQTDVQNQVSDIYNWKMVLNTDPSASDKYIWVPDLKVMGNNEGLLSSFTFTQDLFSSGDKTLINGKEYYFMAVAYAHNNWKNFDNITKIGQRTLYLQGLRNIKIYKFIPKQVFADNEPRLKITRISGEGNPHTFLQLEDFMYDRIMQPGFDGKMVYKTGYGPLQGKVTDESKNQNKIYRLEINGNFLYSRSECAFDEDAVWRLTNITDNVVLLDNKHLSYVKEYVLDQLGFSITINNHSEPGTMIFENNGGVGATLEYKDPTGTKWFSAVTEGGKIHNVKHKQLNYIRDYVLDPTGALSNLGNGYFVPFLSTRFESEPDLPFYLSPAARDFMAFMTNSANNSIKYRDLNNVDIVITSDKSKWSKCVVVETASNDYINAGFLTIGNSKNLEVRWSPSIDKNGNAVNDGTFGYSYFPGYAIDVETGKRLNIFFGENSVFSGQNASLLDGNKAIGGDLIFNPSSQITSVSPGVLKFVAGGQHYIYVTRQEYDECKTIYDKLKKTTSGISPSIINKSKAGPAVTWVSFPILSPDTEMKSISDGLIPNDLIIKLRVDNPYGESRKYNIERERDCETYSDQPVYEFGFDKFTSSIPTDKNLSKVFISPNPAQITGGTIQLTLMNIPDESLISIFDLNSKLIKRFNADDYQFDFRNQSGISKLNLTVNSGILPRGLYLVHIKSPKSNVDKVLKWILY